MKELSVFDIIGPNMIGPSSSHTAGALRIALLASKMVKGGIKSVTFTLYGSFARTYHGHGTDKALVAGMLGFDTEDPRIRDSFRIAEKENITFTIEENLANQDVHPNTVDIRIIDMKGQATSIRGESVGGGAAVIRKINGVDISLSGEYSTILVKHKDEKGVLAYIATCLSECDINIAFTKLYREQKGELAYTIIEADEKISEEVISLIEESKNVLSAILIEI